MTHVLVVEDDLPTRREIEAALTDHGFTVSSVDNGREGLLKALGEPFDLIVLDRDVFTVAPEALRDTQVLNTFFAGREIYRRQP